MRRIFFLFLLFPFSFMYASQIVLVKKPVVKIYLNPSVKSDILMEVGFGDYLKLEKSTKKKKGWFLVSDINRITGWIESKNIIPINRENQYITIVKEVNGLLQNPGAGFFNLEKVADFLFRITENSEFTGDEFLYLKTRAGIALDRCVSLYNDASPSFKEKHHFFKEKYSKHLKEKGDVLYIEPEYFWNIADVNQERKVGEYAAYLGVKYYPYTQCDSVVCRLQKLHETKLRYLYTWFNGNYAKRFDLEIKQELDGILKKKDYCQDFEKSSVIIDLIKKKIVEIPSRYAQGIGSRLDVIVEDCAN